MALGFFFFNQIGLLKGKNGQRVRLIAHSAVWQRLSALLVPAQRREQAGGWRWSGRPPGRRPRMATRVHEGSHHLNLGVPGGLEVIFFLLTKPFLVVAKKKKKTATTHDASRLGKA